MMTAAERFHLMTKDSALKANLSNGVKPFAGEKNNVMYLYFLEELFHQLFSLFSVVRPKGR